MLAAQSCAMWCPFPPTLTQQQCGVGRLARTTGTTTPGSMTGSPHALFFGHPHPCTAAGRHFEGRRAGNTHPQGPHFRKRDALWCPRMRAQIARSENRLSASSSRLSVSGTTTSPSCKRTWSFDCVPFCYCPLLGCLADAPSPAPILRWPLRSVIYI